MSITASSLYRDTGNFFRHQFVTILLMALLTAFISVIIGHALTPSAEQLAVLAMPGDAGSGRTSLIALLQSLTPEQQQVLLKASAAGTFASLVGNTLLLGGMLMLIPQVSAGQRVSALRAIGASAPVLPKMLLLVFLITLLVQLGTMVMVIPGIFLAVLLALAPMLMQADNLGVVAALRASWRLAWRNLRLVAPAVLLWIIAKLVLIVVASGALALPPTVAAVLLTALGNLISAVLIIYLSRLTMLLR
ncbi:YciC family protein [Pantoea sp. 1.19]|uniref:YciC family protein n=1 Tax=Pantoea sp. 1.19 TaxID=1925589 RepID=UPI00094913CB|nr:YciC family protein [Pantoea sp. 1.19]